MAVHPGGQYLYTTSDATLNNATMFAINQTTGAPIQVGSPVTADANPGGVTVGPGGTNLYVTNYLGDTVSAFSIGGGSTLTSLGSALPSGVNPVGIAVAP